jgi:hypothetical protein
MGTELMITLLLGAYTGSMLNELKKTDKTSFTAEDIASASVIAMKEITKSLSSIEKENKKDVDITDFLKN